MSFKVFLILLAHTLCHITFASLSKQVEHFGVLPSLTPVNKRSLCPFKHVPSLPSPTQTACTFLFQLFFDTYLPTLPFGPFF